MRTDRIAVRIFEVLSRSAGDLTWQRSDDPACVPPPGMGPADRLEWFARWDSAGPGMVSRRAWTRIRTAVDVCNSCPLRAECLAYAADHATRVEGVWGGMYFPARGPAQHPPAAPEVTAA